MTIPEAIKPAGDILAVSTLAAVLADIVTAVAAIFTIVWTAIRIYEMWTGLPFHQTPVAKKLKSKR